MNLRATLAALVEAAPPDATVPVRWLGELLAAEGQTPQIVQPGGDVVDLTVKEVAARFGRRESTIRGWLARGDLEGAYRLHGREWRIPVSSIDRLQRAQRELRVSRPSQGRAERSPDIGGWRRHLKRESKVPSTTAEYITKDTDI